MLASMTANSFHRLMGYELVFLFQQSLLEVLEVMLMYPLQEALRFWKRVDVCRIWMIWILQFQIH
jgi:hypothetical protein